MSGQRHPTGGAPRVIAWAATLLGLLAWGCQPTLDSGGESPAAGGQAGEAGAGGVGGEAGGAAGAGGVGGVGGEAGGAAGAGGGGVGGEAGGGAGGVGGGASPDAAALYAQHCARCHGPARLGGVAPALDPLDWERDALLTKITDTMPPGEPEACAGECAEQVTDWLLAQAAGGDALDCAEAPLELPPRRLRLLTRRAYDNSVRDLLWPEAAAVEVCGEMTFVYVPRDEPNARTVHVAGTFNDWPPTVAEGGLPMQYDPGSGTWRLTAIVGEGIHRYKFVVDEARWYHDTANDWSEADGFGGLNSVVELRCGGAAGIPAGRPSRAFPPEVRPAEFPFDNHAASATVSSVHLDEYLNAAETLAAAAVPDALPCDGGDGCVDRLLDEIAGRAFRRPLSADERARYRALFADDGFEAGATRFVAAVLSSPHFLYRSELGEPVGDGTWRLTGPETATALAYFLWGTLPDAALVEAARSGALDAPAGVEQQARRMLADPRARGTLGTFAEQWLGIEPLLETTRAGDFDSTLRSALLAETRRFVSAVAFDGPHRFEALLTAEHTYVNDVIARHYGMAPVEGAALREAPAPAARRAGILGHGAVLATHAHADQSSPIRRGLFVRNRLLCQPLPPAPPNAGGVPDVDPGATTRERFRQHTDDPFCAACHQYIDDVGFGFEQFDHLGAFRETENGQPVDARGDMNDIEGLGTGTSAPFEGLPALGAELAASHAARACFVTQVQRFALGVDAPGPCEVEALTAELVEAGDDIRELLVLIVTAPTFTLRTEEAP